MTCSLAALRVTNHLLDANVEGWLGRVLEAKAALPQILDERQPLIVFYGSSMVQAGFSPRQFDAAMNAQGIDVKSFNFGFGGLNPLFQNIFARRIRDAFKRKDRRLKLALIEFNPFQATTTRRNRARPVEDSFFAKLCSPQELAQMALSQPERGIRLLNIRCLRGGVSAEMITSHFGRSFQSPLRQSDLQPNEAMAKKRQELGEILNKRFEEDYPDYTLTRWSYPWQGGGTIPEERSADTLQIVDDYYETLLTPYRMDNARLRRIQTTDIIDLHFEEESVVAFIALVEAFKQFSDKVEIVMLPKNTKWIQNPPEALARLKTVTDRIEAETGLPVRDFQSLEQITPEMFRDSTHLNRYRGAVAFTSFLVERYADDLR